VNDLIGRGVVGQANRAAQFAPKGQVNAFERGVGGTRAPVQIGEAGHVFARNARRDRKWARQPEAFSRRPAQQQNDAKQLPGDKLARPADRVPKAVGRLKSLMVLVKGDRAAGPLRAREVKKKTGIVGLGKVFVVGHGRVRKGQDRAGFAPQQHDSRAPVTEQRHGFAGHAFPANGSGHAQRVHVGEQRDRLKARQGRVRIPAPKRD
jgi:hypothetical protein